MHRMLDRPGSLRLQHILIIGFALTATITVAVGSLIIYRLINSYLQEAQDARVGRDMDLAEAFFDLKRSDITTTSQRLATRPAILANLARANQGDVLARLTVQEEVNNELSVLPPDSQRFIVVTDARGFATAGRICCRNSRSRLAVPNADWSQLPIVAAVLTQRKALSATEVIPADILRWIGLDEQAQITLLPTEKAAPVPFDPREGTAGLTSLAVTPILSPEGELQGAVLVGHLFNNDFTLVDRIKEVAGVDTVTIFFGDLRVSTNVLLNGTGQRAIGTRVSQEVYDKVLIRGEEFTGEAFVVNQNYITRYRALRDHLSNVVGILYVGARQAAFQSLLDSFRTEVYLIAAATLLLAIVLAIPVAWFIARPLTELAEATHQVAGGDWSVRVPGHGYREMRTLAQSFNTMMETLKDKQEQLVQKEKLASVGQLAAGVAHEINNPLGSVLLYADILRKETPEDNPQQRADLEMILNEATRCKAIVNDLLNFSRQNEVLAQETDLNMLLSELAEEAAKQELFQQVELIPDLAPDLPPIQADPLQLRQVFLNLMDNAAEAMPHGGRLTLCTRKGPMEGLVTAEVQDTGVGIPAGNIKKLFTPFFTTKPIGKGTGLGLAIIYGIVKMHQGQISVQSQVGKGTTFTITLRERLPAAMERPKGSFVLQ